MAETLPKRIRRLREAREMSRGDLALDMRSKSGSSMILNWEEGKSEPTSRWLLALADSLQVSTHYLLIGKESRHTGNRGGAK